MATFGRPPMPKRLIVAPHLDDAVLSVWHVLTQGDATVVTVLAGIPDDPEPPGWDRETGATDSRERMNERREEDRRVLEALGAQAIHLNFLDQQYRKREVPHQQMVDALEVLAADFDEVWMPAGLAHQDHRDVARAALAATVGLLRVMYADLPYAAAEWAAHTVALTGEDNESEVGAWKLAVLGSCPIAPPELPEIRRLTDLEAESKRQAILGYRTQFERLVEANQVWWNSDDLFGREWFWRMTAETRPAPPLLSLPAIPDGLTIDNAPAPGEPFLSVIVRTRGTRVDTLTQTLASLSKQTRRDFELLLVTHDISPPDSEHLDALLEDLPDWLRQVLRRIDVTGGHRGRPLNAGLTEARGLYFAVLDDDDLALPQWVEEFARLGARDPGYVLRTCVEVIDKDGVVTGRPFPESFDLVEHLIGNRSPICGLAFPRWLMKGLAASVDESLDVVEDWDLVLQTVPYAGVSQSAKVTSQYRDWDDAVASRSMHPTYAWGSAMRSVRDKADRRPLLFPPGSLPKLVHERLRLHELGIELPLVASELDSTRRALSHVEGERDRIREALDQTREALDLAHEASARARADAAAAEMRSAAERRVERTEWHRQSTALHAHVREVEQQFRTSTSWRVTAPLRALSELRSPNRTNRRDVTAFEAASQPDPPKSWPLSYFANQYAQNPDPWGYETEWYEQRKYQLTAAALPRLRYRRGFEPGCSIGVLSEMLAGRCDELLSVDAIPAAVDQARDRLAHHTGVRVRLMQVPFEWPYGKFDLIVISELAYYLNTRDLSHLIDRCLSTLEQDGHLVLVHHRLDGTVPQSAESAHRSFIDRPELVVLAEHDEPQFLLNVLGLALAP